MTYPTITAAVEGLPAEIDRLTADLDESRKSGNFHRMKCLQQIIAIRREILAWLAPAIEAQKGGGE